MKRRCITPRIIFIIAAASYLSSVSMMLTIMLKNKQLNPLSKDDAGSVEILNSSIVENVFHARNACASHVLGVPFSITKLGCTRRSCEIVTCDKLFDGDAAAINAAKHFQRHSLSDDEVSKLASDCTTLRQLGGYRLTPVRDTDADFPIAFTMLLHLNAEQFERLLRAIYRPQNIYCIHVDIKSSEELHAAVKAIVNCFHNVFLATHLHYVVYAGHSRLQADIDCMKDHLAHSVKWHYVINLPGQAYPLRTPEEMVDILRIYNGVNDIEGIYRRRFRPRYVYKWQEWISTNESGIRKTGETNKLPPHNLDIVRGSAYGLFSRKFVEFIINDQRAKDLLEWSRNTYSPDEHYWATLHHTSYNPQLHTPGGYSGNPDKKEFMAVYAKWSTSKIRGVKCAGKYVRWVCIIGVGDLASLLPRHELFVNKFDIDFEPLAFECAEQWLQHRVQCPAKFDSSFYSRLSFVVDHRNRLIV